MTTFINLPVSDIERSRRFFTTLGFGFEDMFCTDTSLGMKLGDGVMVMMLSNDRFADFIPGRAIADTGKVLEVLTAIECESREAVDALMDKALSAGAEAYRAPEEHGFMYGRSFTDPDGHVWEPFWFDASSVPETSQ